MQQEQFDAIVVGSGQGGNPLAKAMANKGWRVAVVERRFAGGTCVNDGCTPSKTIDASARVAYLVKRGLDFGVNTGPVSVNMHEVWRRKQEIVLESRQKNREGLEKVCSLLFGEASFAKEKAAAGMHAITVRMNNGSGDRNLIAPRILLNTGERPHPPKVDGLDAVPYLDSTSIMELQTVPEHLIILGAGYIALEFAQMFLRFGAKVTVLERGERIAAQEDDDIADCLRDILQGDGMEILTCSAVMQVRGGEGDVTLDVTTDDGNRTLHGSHLLVATGRTPNVEPLHLERVGVEQTERGYVKVNDRLETTVPGIWAMGDVKGGPAFTHVSYDDFRILRANVLEGGAGQAAGASIHDRLTTYVMFTDPELGRVGISEKEAAEQGRTVRVAAISMRQMARAHEMDEMRGMMKALVDPETDLIVGAVVLGVDGGEVTAQMQIAMMGGMKYTALRDGMFSHPTKAEALNTLFGSFRDGQP